MENKTSKELRKEYNKALNKVSSTGREITDKLLQLSQLYPDAPVKYPSINREEFYTAKSLNNKFYVDTLPVPTRLQYIEMIETYIGETEAKQLTITFNDEVK